MRPGFRIAELQIGPTQKVPWHYHNNVHDTFYVVAGSIRIFLQDPKEEIRLTPGQTFAVLPSGRTSSLMQAIHPQFSSFYRASANTISFPWPDQLKRRSVYAVETTAATPWLQFSGLRRGALLFKHVHQSTSFRAAGTLVGHRTTAHFRVPQRTLVHFCDAPIPCFERDEHENQTSHQTATATRRTTRWQIEITIQAIANLDRRTVKSTGRLKSQPVGANEWTLGHHS
jgi:hypothetical protein